MRVIANIPHPSISITVFQMNEKYIVKFEAGPMEQSFKYSTTEINGLDHIKSLIDETFIESVRKRFNDMYLQLQESIKKSTE